MTISIKMYIKLSLLRKKCLDEERLAIKRKTENKKNSAFDVKMLTSLHPKLNEFSVTYERNDKKHIKLHAARADDSANFHFISKLEIVFKLCRNHRRLMVLTLKPAVSCMIIEMSDERF